MATEQQKAWLEDYLEKGNAIEAVERCFPGCGPASRPARASQLKAKWEEEIDKRIRDGYKQSAPLAASIIKDLCSNAKQEAVKLKAAQDILSRAGHDSALVIEDPTEKRSYAELQQAVLDAVSTLGEHELIQVAPALEALRPKERDHAKETTH